ncbi:unnamed protein product, partial [Rotaria magnacalcarata]
TLATLDLKNNMIETMGAIQFPVVLMYNTTLTTLDVTCNQINDKWLEYLGDA